MTNKCFRKATRFISVLLVFALISGGVSATVELVQPLASDYITSCTAKIISYGDGEFVVDFSIIGRNTMLSIGVTEIEIQWSLNGTSWNDGESILASEYPSMLGTNRIKYSSSVPFTGVEGRYYRAYVTFYASNASGSDSATITTLKVQI